MDHVLENARFSSKAPRSNAGFRFIETCKLHSVNPQVWLTDVLTKLVNRWPARRIDELMPWACVKPGTIAQAA